MASLLELSHELLHCIFTEIEPADLASLSRTCRDLNHYIRGNRLLHKDLYLRAYDEPRCLQQELDWQEELHDLVKLHRIMTCGGRENKAQYLRFVADRIDSLMRTAAADSGTSANVAHLSKFFDQDDTDGIENVDAFLCASNLFAKAGTELQQPAPTSHLRQASAKLHCLYGVPIDRVPNRRSYSISRSDASPSPSSYTRSQCRPVFIHSHARSKVYDLRQYTDATLWGPFLADGSQRVDWEKVEAVMIVLGYNLNKFTERSDGRWPRVWHKPFAGATPNSYVSGPPASGPTKDLDDETLKIRELALSLDSQDPYGVSGTWMRIVCFLDYNDLYAFNFASRIPDDEDREPIDIEEAIRLIKIKLQVTRIDAPGSGDEDEEEDGMDWSGFTGERLPVVHFRGSSRSLHASWDPNANSRIRGTVRQTPEGEIRWTTFSIFHGEERWRSEGIQVGGLKSARGVLGNWFDKDYDIHGPAGPTAFWKLTDELEEEKSSGIPFAFY